MEPWAQHAALGFAYPRQTRLLSFAPLCVQCPAEGRGPGRRPAPHFGALRPSRLARSRPWLPMSPMAHLKSPSVCSGRLPTPFCGRCRSPKARAGRVSRAALLRGHHSSAGAISLRRCSAVSAPCVIFGCRICVHKTFRTRDLEGYWTPGRTRPVSRSRSRSLSLASAWLRQVNREDRDIQSDGGTSSRTA